MQSCSNLSSTPRIHLPVWSAGESARRLAERNGASVARGTEGFCPMPVPFVDRCDAGRQLASKLMEFADDARAVVLALPRGGVPVAYEVAVALHAPLDVFVVRKLGVPGHRELAMGAIASGGVRVLNSEVIDALRIQPAAVESVAARELDELERQQRTYRGNQPLPELAGRIVILVDDGLATGSTMRAAIAAVRQSHPARIVVAVPVAALETARRIGREADTVVFLYAPQNFYAVSMWYQDFSQTTDEEVRQLLRSAQLALDQHKGVTADADISRGSSN